MEDKNATEEAKDDDATTELPQQEETHAHDDPEEKGQQELNKTNRGLTRKQKTRHQKKIKVSRNYRKKKRKRQTKMQNGTI
jgi:hypothetical protein